MDNLSNEQKVMEARYVLPFSWFKKKSTRHWRQKNGIWTIAKELAGDIKGKTVLDAGCGDGWYTALMASEGAVVYGTDYSGKAISFAKLIIPDATFTDGSLLQLPYEDNFFDVVFSFQVLEHIPPVDLPQAIREVQRVLKPGGLFIPSVPTVVRPMSTAHYQHFTSKTITEVLTPTFTVEKIVGQECYDWLLKIIERIIENRYWLLYKVAERFHSGLYLRRWNRGEVTKAYNFIVKAQK